MNSKKIFFLAFLAFVISISAQSDTRRPSLPRRLGKSSTTSTVQPPEYDQEGEYSQENNDEEESAYDYGHDDEEVAVVASTTTTTAPKKLINIRPFRSNDDLLQALKRRQLNAKSVKKVSPTTASTIEEPMEEDSKPEIPQAKAEDRKARGRFGNIKKSIKSTKHADQEEFDEEKQEDLASVPIQPTRRSLRNRFAVTRN